MIKLFKVSHSQYLTASLVGNKAKGRILKQVFQENKARQIFQKNNISYPLIRAYQGKRNVRFSENLACFVFSKHVLRFTLLPYYRRTQHFHEILRNKFQSSNWFPGSSESYQIDGKYFMNIFKLDHHLAIISFTLSELGKSSQHDMARIWSRHFFHSPVFIALDAATMCSRMLSAGPTASHGTL